MKKIFLFVFILQSVFCFSQTRLRDAVKADPTYILPKANGGFGQVFQNATATGQALIWNGSFWNSSGLLFPSGINVGEIMFGAVSTNQLGSLPELFYDHTSSYRTFGITKNINSNVSVNLKNENTGAFSSTRFILENSSNTFSIEKGSTGYSTSGNVTANTILLKNTNGNTVLNNTANFPIIFEVNNVEKFRMTSTGLGVLNTNPLEALDVTGNINISGSIKAGGGFGTNGQVLTSNGAGGINWTTISGGGGGSGTVTSVTVTPNNGISAVVTGNTTNANLYFSLGNIYPSTLTTDSLNVQRDGNFSNTPQITAAKISGRGALMSNALELFSNPIIGGIGNTLITNATGANAGGTNNSFIGVSANASFNTAGTLYAQGGTDAIGLNIEASSATGKNYAINITKGDLVINKGRILEEQATAVASVAGSITLSNNGNVFEITGTNAITLISNIGWKDGSEITLLFTSTATLTDGTANSGTNIGMEISGNANHVATAGDVAKLVLSTIGGTQRWRSVSPIANN